ncbi:uncharacterized protein N7479_008396 [Penicillium vulpinum]|uniref:uncharacterized protein n=1 Tax=Penicillium vulpinum TaxID=29845 RepID=UPI002549B659|nr:uncharacterized protein N7479_008396 [Penicillium vulpinum]KAJ5961246.1 hypothetical protein N7479_008396 [Penicillium vulpinum]
MSRWITKRDREYEQIRLLHFNGRFFDIAVFVDIIIAEYLLREIVQREQFLKNKVRASKKLAEDQDKETRYDEALRNLLRQYSEAEYELYLTETMLPVGRIKQSYDSLRQNPTWYLRKELVEDCVKRGAAVVKAVDAVKLAMKKLKETRYWTIERGFEYTTNERECLVDDFKPKLYDNNPACVIQMAEAFFLLPPEEKPQEERTQGKSNKNSALKRVFRKS